MNVLLLDQYGELGGAQRCLLDLIPGLKDGGWRAHALVPAGGELKTRLESLGVEVAVISPGAYRSGRKSLGDAIRFAGKIPRLAEEIRRRIRRWQIGLVYVNGPRLLPAVALARAGRPVLFHAHSYLHRDSARKMAGWALRHTGATVAAVSRFVADSLTPWVPPSRMHVILNGTADLSRPHNGQFPCAGVVGRIAPEKGQREFVAAARLVLEAIPQCRFVLCGAAVLAPPDYDREVRARAQGMPVEFTGWQEDVGAILARLDLLVVPAVGEEGLCRVVIEAFSAKVPVVAFNSGGIRELVEDTVTGFLVKERTPEALARRIVEVLRDRERMRTVADRARALWEARLTLGRYRGAILEVMDRAAASRTPAPQPAPDKQR
ncbi:MAG: glycosyltransferase family 4 protein [Bryobacterales bacterium]|nr:glycosyltransferase family 4 protein [Bryobacterales bacterium]